jgi:methyl-accepting chemotaxis protein
MSQAIPSEKITEYINILFKKENIFQKIDKIKSYTLYFILFSSVIGISTIFMNYSNFKDNEKSLDEINTSLDEINTSLDEITTSLDEINTSLDEIKNSLYEIKNTSTIKSNSSISTISSIDSDSCETPFISIN